MLNTLNYAKPAFEGNRRAWSPRGTLPARLGHSLPHLSPAQRGLVGGSLHTGALTLVRATLEQSAYLAHTNTTYAWAGAKLSPAECALVWDGVLPLLAPKPARHVASDDEDARSPSLRVCGVDHALEVIAKADQVAIAA